MKILSFEQMKFEPEGTVFSYQTENGAEGLFTKGKNVYDTSGKICDFMINSAIPLYRKFPTNINMTTYLVWGNADCWAIVKELIRNGKG